MLLVPHLAIGLDDMFQYDMLARSLAAGNGYRWYAPADAARIAPYLNLDLETLDLDPRGIPTTFRAPLYPAFLSFVYLLFGAGPERFFPVRLAQAVLGALLAPLTYYAGRMLLERTGWGREDVERAARGAGAIIAVYPLLIVYPLGLATENLFFPLVLAAVLILLHLSSLSAPAQGVRGSRWTETHLAVLAGLALGLAALTRSVILPFAVGAALWIWLGLGRPRAAALATLALVCTIAPWIVRNTLVAGRITGIETSMGYNLYLGYHPQSSGSFTFGPSLDLLSILDDQQREQVGIEKAMGFIRDDPARFPYLALRRLGHFFDLEWRAFTYFYTNGLLGPLSAPVLILTLCLLSLPFVFVASASVFGAITLRRGPETGLLAVLIVAYLLPHVFILSEERFHLAILPYLAILASSAWVGCGQLLRASPSTRWMAALGVLLLVFNWGAQLVQTWPTLARMIAPGGNGLYLPY